MKGKLSTERLILRKFTEDDMEALYSILKDEEVNVFLPWFPMKDIEETTCFFKDKIEETYKQPDGYYYAVCLKDNDSPIGYIDVSAGDSHDLGYGLKKEFWHQGIMTEAGKAVIEQARKDGLPYLTATHDIKNPRSGRVMKQIGMKYQYSYEEVVRPKNELVTFRLYQLNLDGNKDRIYKGYWNRFPVHFVEEEI